MNEAQEGLEHLCNPHIYYYVHCIQRLDSTQYQINPHCSFIYCLQYILILSLFQAPEAIQAGHVKYLPPVWLFHFNTGILWMLPRPRLMLFLLTAGGIYIGQTDS